MIKIVTDSTSDLSLDVARQHGIEVVPLRVHFGEQTFRDRLDLSSQQFFRLLKSSPRPPTSSQPPAGEFLELYRRLAADGSSIISIHLSSRLSGTYASACAARDMLEGANVHVVDTLIISACQGWMAMEAARMAAAGQPVETILDRLEYMKKNSHLYLTLDTLEYLHKGGRIGGAQALLGTALQVKPILMVQDGRVEVFERIRTRPKAVARAKEIVLHHAAGHKRVYLAILHAADEDIAHRLHDELVPQLDNLVESAVVEVGPTISTHTGPGGLGVAFFVE
jgi:DegV family protein with EDD domain